MNTKSTMLKILFILFILSMITPYAFAYNSNSYKYYNNSAGIVYCDNWTQNYCNSIWDGAATWNSQGGANFYFYNASYNPFLGLPSDTIQVYAWNTSSEGNLVGVTYYGWRWIDNKWYYNDTYIVFNSSKIWSTQNFIIAPIHADVHTVSMHEFGHALGLDHSSTSTSIMYKHDLGIIRRNLDADDKNGIQAIYGKKSLLSGLTNSLHSLGITPSLSSSNFSKFELEIVEENEVFFSKKVIDEYLNKYENVRAMTFLYEERTDADLVNYSDLIVCGTITEISSGYWETADGLPPSKEELFRYPIFHDIIIEVDDVYKGKIDNQTITIKQIGGVVDGYVLLNLDSFNYQKDNQVLLCLSEKLDSKGDNAYYSIIHGGEMLVMDNGLLYDSSGNEVELSQKLSDSKEKI